MIGVAARAHHIGAGSPLVKGSSSRPPCCATCLHYRLLQAVEADHHSVHALPLCAD